MKISSPILRFPYNVFGRSKVLNVDEVGSNIFPFMNHNFGVLFKHLCLVQGHRDFVFHVYPS